MTYNYGDTIVVVSKTLHSGTKFGKSGIFLKWIEPENKAVVELDGIETPVFGKEIAKVHPGQKFKVGDEVTVNSPCSRFKNSIGVVNYYIKHSSGFSTHVKIDGHVLSFGEEELSLYQKEKKMKQKFTIGDKVVINKNSSLLGTTGVVVKYVPSLCGDEYPPSIYIDNCGQTLSMQEKDLDLVESAWRYGCISEEKFNPKDVVVFGGYDKEPETPHFYPMFASLLHQNIKMWYKFIANAPDFTYTPEVELKTAKGWKVSLTDMKAEGLLSFGFAIYLEKEDKSVRIAFSHTGTKKEAVEAANKLIDTYCKE